ncbi:hypothetical protein D3C80_2028780 [compost metagenome]
MHINTGGNFVLCRRLVVADFQVLNRHIAGMIDFSESLQSVNRQTFSVQNGCFAGITRENDRSG